MNYPPDDIERTPEPEEEKMPADDRPDDESVEDRSIHYGDLEENTDRQATEPEQQEEIPEFDFSAMESQARANIEELGFAPLPEIERPAPRRRRQRQPMLTRISEDEMPDRLENMARRTVPTFDFFVFALVAGTVMGIGFLLDSPAILLLAVALAPFPGPWLGVSLAAASGESRFFNQTLGGFFTAIVIVFVTGWLAGLASRIFMPLVLDQAYQHARLWWPDLLLVILGTISLLLLFIAKDEKPILPGLILSYELLLPVSAAGFGLGNNTPGLWPQALGVFLVHLALSIVLALAIFYYMGFRPLEPIGYAWGAGVILVSLMIVIGFAGIRTLPQAPAPLPATATPTLAQPVPLPSLTPAPSSTATPSPVPPTITTLPTDTPRPSPTPVVIPTVAYGRIQFGATIRTAPGGTGITTIMDGYVVEILPDEPVTIDGNTWIRVKLTTASRVIEGWVLQNLVVTPTPQP